MSMEVGLHRYNVPGTEDLSSISSTYPMERGVNEHIVDMDQYSENSVQPADISILPQSMDACQHSNMYGCQCNDMIVPNDNSYSVNMQHDINSINMQNMSIGHTPALNANLSMHNIAPTSTGSEIELARRLGVRFDSSNAAWVARWIDPHSEKKKSRWFSVAKYGELSARRLAIQACLQNMKASDFLNLRDLQDVLAFFMTFNPLNARQTNGLAPGEQDSLASFLFQSALHPDFMMMDENSAAAVAAANGKQFYPGAFQNSFAVHSNYLATLPSVPFNNNVFQGTTNNANNTNNAPVPPIDPNLLICLGVPHDQAVIGTAVDDPEASALSQSTTDTSENQQTDIQINNLYDSVGLKKESTYCIEHADGSIQSSSPNQIEKHNDFDESSRADGTINHSNRISQPNAYNYSIAPTASEQKNRVYSYDGNQWNSQTDILKFSSLKDSNYTQKVDDKASTPSNNNSGTINGYGSYNYLYPQTPDNRDSNAHSYSGQSTPSNYEYSVYSSNYSNQPFSGTTEGAQTSSDVNLANANTRMPSGSRLNQEFYSTADGSSQLKPAKENQQPGTQPGTTENLAHSEYMQQRHHFDFAHYNSGNDSSTYPCVMVPSMSAQSTQLHGQQANAVDYSPMASTKIELTGNGDERETETAALKRQSSSEHNRMAGYYGNKYEDEHSQEGEHVSKMRKLSTYGMNGLTGNDHHSSVNQRMSNGQLPTAKSEPNNSVYDTNDSMILNYTEMDLMTPQHAQGALQVAGCSSESSLNPSSPHEVNLSNEQLLQQMQTNTYMYGSTEEVSDENQQAPNDVNIMGMAGSMNGGANNNASCAVMPYYLQTMNFQGSSQQDPAYSMMQGGAPNFSMLSGKIHPSQLQAAGLTSLASQQQLDLALQHLYATNPYQFPNFMPFGSTPNDSSYIQADDLFNDPSMQHGGHYKRVGNPNGVGTGGTYGTHHGLSAKMTCERGLHYSKNYRGNQECWIAVWNTKGGRIMHEAFDVTVMGFEQAKSKAREARDAAHSNNLAVAENSRPSWKSHSNTGIPHVSLDSQQLRFRAHKFGRRLCRSFSFGRRRGSFASRESAFDAAVLWLIQTPTEEEIAAVSGVSTKIDEPL